MRGDKLIALRITLIYAFFSGLWLVASEFLLSFLIGDRPLRDTIETVLGIVFIILSATFVYLLLRYELQQQSRARAAQRQSEARFRQIIEKNADSMVVVDGHGLVRFVNPAAEQLFGRSTRELQGSPFGFPVVAGETAELDILRPGAGPSVAEMRVVETTWENQPAFLASLRDISDRKQAEATMRDLTMLKETEHLKDKFVSNVSHEIRTPLSVLTLLSGNLDTLYDRLDESKRRALIRDIRSYARLLNDLIAGILEISRIDSGYAPLPHQRINLGQLLHEEADKQQPLAQRKAQYLNVTTTQAVLVDGNEAQVRQMIRNLINNAIKYTPESGDIHCVCQVLHLPLPDTGARAPLASNGLPTWPTNLDMPDGDWAGLHVSDTGVGIAKEHLPRVLERFFRVESGGSVPGTGLGLAIVSELVKLHGGYIAIASEASKGSTFAIYLPLATAVDNEVFA
ncbi:MAG: PAS domain-containing sensor histidine kinase [Chloroflexaceae bacterium]|nr:PAS domain-containing sensor histidine kinase [Chloroflexaceae bacterium]